MAIPRLAITNRPTHASKNNVESDRQKSKGQQKPKEVHEPINPHRQWNVRLSLTLTHPNTEPHPLPHLSRKSRKDRRDRSEPHLYADVIKVRASNEIKLDSIPSPSPTLIAKKVRRIRSTSDIMDHVNKSPNDQSIFIDFNKPCERYGKKTLPSL